MFGKTGVGKSATANSLAGSQLFKVGISQKWVTDKSSDQRFSLNSYKYLGVDTPGLFDSRFAGFDPTKYKALFDHLVNNFQVALNYCGTYVNALIVCISATERCDLLQSAVVHTLSTIFSSSVEKNTILCITRCDEFHSEEEYSEWFAKSMKEEENFRKLVFACGSRVFPVSNKQCDWNWNWRENVLNQIRSLPEYSSETFTLNTEQIRKKFFEASEEVKTKTGSDAGCIASHQRVTLLRGTMEITAQLHAIRKGDLILTDEGFQSFIGWLHEHRYTFTVIFGFSNGTTLEVTSDHLIYTKTGFELASIIVIGDELGVMSTSSEVQFEHVVSISYNIAQVSAPLTKSGTLIVNNCIVSCFANSTQSLAKAVFLPLCIGLFNDAEAYTNTVLNIYSMLPYGIKSLLPVK